MNNEQREIYEATLLQRVRALEKEITVTNMMLSNILDLLSKNLSVRVSIDRNDTIENREE